MGYYVVHVLGYDYHAFIDHEQLKLKHEPSGETRIIQLEDVAMIVAASPRSTITTPALARLGEEDIPLVSCNRKFEPKAITHPYHSSRNTKLVRAQANLKKSFKQILWDKIVNEKVRRQRNVIPEHHEKDEKIQKLLSDDELESSQLESQAARHYWEWFFKQTNTREGVRKQQSRSGFNGMLDYGYVVLRTAILRSLAGHGFIASLGLHHKTRRKSLPLADDLVEPFRPLIDQMALEQDDDFDPDEDKDWDHWVRSVSDLLGEPIPVERDEKEKRLLYVIDSYVEGLGQAMKSKDPEEFVIPEFVSLKVK